MWISAIKTSHWNQKFHFNETVDAHSGFDTEDIGESALKKPKTGTLFRHYIITSSKLRRRLS